MQQPCALKRFAPLALVILAACGAPKNIPALPDINTASFEPAVREAVSKALADAKASPRDAAKSAELGLVLHAHEQYGAAAAAYARSLALDASANEIAYFHGLALAANGKYAESLDPLRRAVSALPQPVVRLRLADSLLATGDMDAARREYQAVVAADANIAAAHHGLGRTLTGADAIAAHEKALALFPRYGAAQFAIANAYRQAGRAPDAAKVLANYERDKTMVPPIDDPASEKIYARNVSATGLLRRAQILDSEGNTAAALGVHEQVVQSTPGVAQAWINLISLHARTGNPAKAEGAYRRAIALDAKNADAHYNFGVFCVQSERWAKAGRAFEQALAVDPRHAQAAHNLGAVVERTGDLARATRLFRQTVELDPGHRLAHFHLGRIYANQRRYAEARAEFERIIEPADAQSPTYLYALGAVEARAGDRSRARETLAKAKAAALRFSQQQVAEAIDRDLTSLAR